MKRADRLAARSAEPRVGRTVVACRGCGKDRWYGYGPCSHCGESGPAHGRLEEPPAQQQCSMGVGCDESGVCYAAAHGQPDRCGRP